MKILIISFSDLKNDPRVFRQISYFSRNNEITCIGLKTPDIEKVKFLSFKGVKRGIYGRIVPALSRISGQYGLLIDYRIKVFYATIKPISDENFDVIIANDIETLPLALSIKKRAKVLFDAHEYAPREYEDLWRWRILHQKYRTYLCKKFIPQCDRMITVCEGIADEYAAHFDVRPEIITNASDYRDLEPSEVHPEKIRIIHHGGVAPSRKLENMIEMMDYTDDRFSLDLMLVPSGPKEYFNVIRTMGEKRHNVRFVDPVPMKDIVQATNHYDIGLYVLEPNSFNNRYALPNKFFEFIQSRLAIAIGPSPEMKKLVKKYNLGIVSDDFSPRTMAEKINALTTEQIRFYKRQSHLAAKELSSERNLETMEKIIRQMIEA